jgi:hypothetical protein
LFKRVFPPGGLHLCRRLFYPYGLNRLQNYGLFSLKTNLFRIIFSEILK